MGGPSRREKDRITYIVSKKQASRLVRFFFKPFEIRLVKRIMVNFLKSPNGFGRRRNATSLKSFERWDLSLF